MIGRAWRGLKTAVSDERGANMFVTLAIMFGLLLLVPVFVDFASLHFSHRISQTGADTAAHAAAVEYALQDKELYSVEWPFPSDWDRFCGATPEEVVMAYLYEWVIPLANDWGIGRGPASTYARRHQSDLEEYWQRYPSHTGYSRSVHGVSIPALEIYAKTRRPVPLIYQSAYGGARQAPAYATAEAYLHPQNWYTERTLECGEEEGKPIYLYLFRFYWVVRLIETED
jgi:hypothetical protein